MTEGRRNEGFNVLEGWREGGREGRGSVGRRVLRGVQRVGLFVLKLVKGWIVLCVLM